MKTEMCFLKIISFVFVLSGCFGKFRGPASSASSSPSPSPAEALAKPSCTEGIPHLIPLYELLNPRLSQHFYTASEIEKSEFIARGYYEIGIAAQIYTKQLEGTLPLQRFRNFTSEDCIYTTSPDVTELSTLGYTFEKNEGFAYPTNVEASFPFQQFKLSTTGEHAYTILDLTAAYELFGYTAQGTQGYACQGGPRLADDTVLAFADVSLTLRGSGFKDNPDSSLFFVSFTDGSSTVTVHSNDATILSWTANSIKVKPPAGLNSRYQVSVTAGDGVASNLVPVRVYAYENFPTIADGDLEPYRMPLDLALDSSGTVWIVNEFARGIVSVVPSTGQSTYHRDVQPENAIFNIDATTKSDISVFGEDVDVDVSGDVWYTEGGDGYYGKGANRVVRFTPTSGQQRCYNIPREGAGIVGVLIDDATGTVYVGASYPSDANGSFIASFRPSTFTEAQSSCTYDFIAPYPADWCMGASTSACFEKFQIPASHSATHLEKGPDGNIWFTESWGSNIGRLDLNTKAITEFPLPNPVSKNNLTSIGTMPWQLDFDSVGNLWISEYAESAVVKFDISKTANADCTTLNSKGDNPCASVINLIYFPLSSPEFDYLHSVAVDAEDQVWFTTHTYPVEKGVGFMGMLNTKSKLQMFPPLTDLGILGGVTGIAVDSKTKDIWFNEFWALKLGHLKYVP